MFAPSTKDDEKTQPWFYDIKDFALKYKAKLLRGDKLCCPTCGRWNQVYHRHLNSGMARQLIALYRLGGSTGYVHCSKLVLEGVAGMGDFSKLKYWCLIEPMEHTEGATKSSGMWKLTGAGVKFVTGQIKLQPTAAILHDEMLEFIGDPVLIHQCLGKKFNYVELMGDGHAPAKTRTA